MIAGILLSHAVKGFLLARQADGYSPSTLAQYRWGLNMLIAQSDKPLTDITIDDLRQCMASVQQSALSPVSIFHVWKAIRAFYKWTSAEGLTSRPDRALAQPRFKLPEVAPFSAEEVKALLRATEKTNTSAPGKRAPFAKSRPLALRDRAIMLVLLDTGIRASELCRLTINDIDLDTGILTVRAYRSGAKSRPRTIPLGQSARKTLWKYFASRPDGNNNEPAFPTLQNAAMNRSGLLRILQHAGERAGVTNCHPHRFRHTFAITFLRNGGDVFTLQRLLGHSSLEMVRHYLDLAQTDDEAAHRRASPVDNWRL